MLVARLPRRSTWLLTFYFLVVVHVSVSCKKKSSFNYNLIMQKIRQIVKEASGISPQKLYIFYG